jgi:hypothetical protein
MDSPTFVSICVVSYNAKIFLEKCISSVLQHTENYELIVVDNASTDSSSLYLQQLELSTVGPRRFLFIRNNKNVGYGSALNQAVRKAKYNTLCFLNCDIEVTANWLYPLVNCLYDNEKIAVVGPKLIFPNGRIGGAGIVGTDKERRIRGWYEIDTGQYNKTEEVVSLCGACMLLKRKPFEEVGGFDERFHHYFEETDLIISLRRKGYKIMYCPNSRIIHYWHKSPHNGKDYFSESKRLFEEKWKGKLE